MLVHRVPRIKANAASMDTTTGACTALRLVVPSKAKLSPVRRRGVELLRSLALRLALRPLLAFGFALDLALLLLRVGVLALLPFELPVPRILLNRLQS